MPAEPGGTSEDAVLGGRLVLRQPLRGHRVGHDGILLAAATDARAGQHAIDLGAGVGVAGLALARRIERLNVTLVEIDPKLAALARENAARNGLAERVQAVSLDVGASVRAFAAAGLTAGSADRVLMNPPFNVPQNPSPDTQRRIAHSAAPGTLRQWTAVALRLLKPGGAMGLIWRADGLVDVLEALASGFGGVALRAIHPKPGAAAIRIVLRAVKSSRAPLVVLPGLVLNDSNGRASVEAESILRDAGTLSMLAQR